MSVIAILLMVMTLYCVGSVGLIWLVCTLMGWPFSVPMAVGVWLIANGVYGAIRKGKKHDG